MKWLLLQRLRLTLWARGVIFDILNRNYRHYEGYCMCGSKCDDHGFGDGHGPVDSWYYHRDQFVYRENRATRRLNRFGDQYHDD